LAWFSILGFSLVLGQAQLRADNSPQVISPPSTNPPPSGAEVATGWNPSPDPNVVGYYLCWGLASGQCTNFIDVGNVTNATLGGLTTSVFYYFTVVAYDTVGDQAPPSNEIQYMAANTVIVPPGIVTDLTNQTVATGSGISLQVGVSGTAPFSYRWLFNGAYLPSATSNVLTLNNVTTAQAGGYQVIVTNSAGAATSAVASLTVMIPPSISADLVNQSAAAGSNVTFQVGVAGTGPFNYQWLFNGTSLAGATANPLTLNKVTQQQAGTYQIRVTNMVGAATSSVASLTVIIPPSISADLVNQTAAAGSNVTFQVGVAGTGPFNYQWLFNGTNLPGATANPLTLNKVTQQQAGTYEVMVSNTVGAVASSVASLSVVVPPNLVVDLTNQTVLVGSNVTFQVSVAGSAPFGYQWLFNGGTMPGATSNPLILNNVSSARAGTYQVVVTNSAGTITSASANLTVLTAPTIVTDLTNQIVAAGTNVTLQVSASGTSPFNYQWLCEGTNLPGATSNPLILSNVVPQQSGSYQVIVSNIVGAAFSSIASLSILSPPKIVANPADQTAAVGANATLLASVAGSAPFGYQWLFNGVALAGATTNPLVLNNLAPSESGLYKLQVTNPVGSVTSSSATLSVLAPPTIVADLTNVSVALGSNATLFVGVAGSAPFSCQWLFNGTPLSGATTNPLVLGNVGSSQAGTYQVIVTNAVGGITSSVASLVVLAPPSIVGNLTNQTVVSGSNVVLGVGLAGSGPFGFQWFFNGTNLIGATQNPMVLNNISAAQAGSYQVVVSNQLGTVQSAIATLDVIEPRTLRLSPLGANALKLTFGAIPLQAYTLQYSTNLNAAWQVLGTAITDSSGVLTFIATKSNPSSFYRVVLP
jgi:hypothetical protein